MQVKIFIGLFFSILLASLTGCDKPTETPGKFVTLMDAEWPYADTLIFNENNDTLPVPLKGVLLTLRHTQDYPYANVWIEMSYQSRDSLVADTFNIRITDEYGKWLGTGSGPVLMLSDTLTLRHTPDTTSRFLVRHVMRTEILPEIEQVGLSFIKN